MQRHVAAHRGRGCGGRRFSRGPNCAKMSANHIIRAYRQLGSVEMLEPGSKTWEIAGAALRSMGTSFPGVASLTQLWSEWEQSKWRNRIVEFVNDLCREIDWLRARVNDLEDRCEKVKEEFPPLVEAAAHAASCEPSRARRRMFARATVRLLLLEETAPVQEKVALMRELETLTDLDLKVLKVFSDGRAHVLKKEQQTWASLGLGQSQQEQVQSLYGPMCKLEARGLLAGTPLPAGVSFVGDDGIPLNWSCLNRRMWIMPRGRVLLHALGSVDQGTNQQL